MQRQTLVIGFNDKSFVGLLYGFRYRYDAKDQILVANLFSFSGPLCRDFKSACCAMC